MATALETQTVWKRVKVPAVLATAGWKLIRVDSSAPFRLRNEKLDLSTPGYPNPEEAIAEARAMQTEFEEGQAVIDEHNTMSTAAPVEVLPVDLVDEGWRLNCDRINSPGRPFVAIFREHSTDFIQTIAHATAAAAVAEAIELEQKRQAEIERREQAAETGNAITGPAWLDGGDPPAADQALAEKLAGLATFADQVNGAPAEILIDLERLRLDGGTQQRITLLQETIDRYAEAMRAGAVFPPVKVFFDGAAYWLADGFYRFYARRQVAPDRPITADVYEGTQRDAILYSVGANETHGLPRTNADKRAAVLVMLNDQEWATWSNIAIAEQAAVSAAFVGNLRKEIKRAEKNTVRRARDGRVIDTANIGSREKKQTGQLPFEGGAGEVAATPHGETVIEDDPNQEPIENFQRSTRKIYGRLVH